MKKSLAMDILVLLLCVANLWASEVVFSGGNTTIKKTGEVFDISLSGGAKVETDQMELFSEEIRIWGENYRFVRCDGTVKALKKDNHITLLTPSLFYDRQEENLLIDSWVEIQDPENEIALSGARLDYSLKNGVMKLQILARIIKQTDDGLLQCSADSITYDSKAQTLELSGRCWVTWGQDNYKASKITIDLNTNELNMEGKISGAVNG